MEKLFFIAVLLIAISCKENSCVRAADVALKDLDESNLDYYKYGNDTLYLDIPSVVTPNEDGINDDFVVITNISNSDFVAVNFKVKNNCDETLHKQNGTFPFIIPNINNLENGIYNFDFSIVLLDKELISGGGIIKIVRK